MNINYKKIIDCKLRIRLVPGSANPGPPVGPILGQKGINIMDFCKKFNSLTENIEKDLPIKSILVIYNDKTFDIIIKKPSVVNLIKKFLNIQKASDKPNLNKVGKLNIDIVDEILRIKSDDLNINNIEAGRRCIIGTGKSMGIDFE